MSTVGQIETHTQTRIVTLFKERLGYDYLGDKADLGNRNMYPFRCPSIILGSRAGW